MPDGNIDTTSCQQFISFDGSTSLNAKVLRPDRYQFFSGAEFSGPAIARGAGLSYVAASFGEKVVTIDHCEFNRIISFNVQERWIEVESGMTLGQLYDFLIKQNLFLATQPGHPRITVGGCIAADVHGKNQFMDGTFINQVLELALYHPDHGVLKISPQENAELFRLTCGGYGLSGNIISAKLKLKEIPSSGADVTLKATAGMDELIAELKRSAGSADFLYSWHDFTNKGKGFGQGFIQEGRFSKGSSTSQQAGKKQAADQSLSSTSRGSIPLPVFNQLSVRMMNILYGARCRKGQTSVSLSLFDSIFPIQHTKELYFKFFGPAGFHESQVIVPEERFPEYVDGVKEFLKKKSLPITLASAKLFSGTSDLLRFSGGGICFALDFPRQKEAQDFLPYLDTLLVRCGGIPNIIKDSHLSRDVVEATYPEYEKFKRLLQEFDPKRLYRSELSERLGL